MGVSDTFGSEPSLSTSSVVGAPLACFWSAMPGANTPSGGGPCVAADDAAAAARIAFSSKARLVEVDDLNGAASLLRWDQMTYMPPGGSAARGRQTATLNRLSHEKFTDVAVGRLLDQLERETTALAPDSDDVALVRVTRRLYERSVRVPASLVSELNDHAGVIYRAWTVARPANDFPSVRPLLEKTLELSRRQANCFPGYESIADPLIDVADHGMKASTVRELFGALRARLVPIVRAITKRSVPDDACLRQHADASEQLAFGRQVAEAYGYDFERGRLDLTPHPFTTRISLGDVRITTRVRESDFRDALFILLHECGHGLYEQGVRRDFEGTPLAGPPTSGIDESQSRLWENLVGRSRGFWEHFYPRLQRSFPKQLRGIALDTFYRAINRVEPSLLRGGADEVTYNLHVMLRFDLEVDLLEGRLEVKDLARVWRERFEADFGIPVPDDTHGVLQDVHWYNGPIGGAFQGYTLGNILSAQLHAAAVAAHPEIPAQIATGELGTLHGWLRENLYQHGAKFTATELVRRATGRDMSIEPYLDCESTPRKFFGTFIRVLGGCGRRRLLGGLPCGVGIGRASACPFAFGLTRSSAAPTAVGHVSGCHLNPAVTARPLRGEALRLEGRCRATSSAQVAGAIVAAVRPSSCSGQRARPAWPRRRPPRGLAAQRLRRSLARPLRSSVAAARRARPCSRSSFMTVILGATSKQRGRRLDLPASRSASRAPSCTSSAFRSRTSRSTRRAAPGPRSSSEAGRSSSSGSSGLRRSQERSSRAKVVPRNGSTTSHTGASCFSR